MQNYTEIGGQAVVKDSRTLINQNFETIQSNNSGSGFPTNYLFAGMKCYRSDTKHTYTLVDVDKQTWVDDASADSAKIADTAKVADKCIGNADTATKALEADKCTGNADTATTAKNISNQGTVTLATATEANQIDITQPSYSPGKPVKLLNFNWYSNRYSIGAVRGGSSDIAGLGIYLNDSNICSWDSKGDLELYTSDGSEKRIYGTGNNCGFSVYQSGLALFDWKNGRNIWNYNQSDNNILCDVSPRFSGDNAITFGPNTGWGGLLRVGGNVDNIPVGNASVATSNGNLHIDAAKGHALYLNYFNGDSIWIGDGTGNGKALATIDPKNGISCGTFTGNLHGTADTAKMLPPLSGDGRWKLAYTADGQRTNAGDWGRVVMHYDDNGQTYGVRCDVADNSDKFEGMSLAQVQSQILLKVAGRSTPTLTSIFDGCYDGNGNKYTKVSNASTGISGYGTGNIRLTQTYKNFDKILIVSANDDCNFEKYILWDTWQLAYAFSTCGWRFDLLNGANNGGYWNIWSTIQAGTSTHPLSTDTIWYLSEENSVMVDIIGVNY